MPTYDSGYIYDDGNIYDSSGSTPSPPSSEVGTISISPPSKIVESNGGNINGIYSFSRVDIYDNSISDSISQTYNSDDLSLANVESPSSSVGTSSGGVVVDSEGTDVVMKQDTLIDPVTIYSAGSRFMR